MDDKRFADLEKQVLQIAAVQVAVIIAIEAIKKDLEGLRKMIAAAPADAETVVH
ncbi:MAG: hypothetical protein GXY47_13355 [Acidobacteria bacterium]|nr:hypothetical protein [Acidobacteriota bacterium]